MGETRVDLVHLLEDLRDAYPASLEAIAPATIQDAARQYLNVENYVKVTLLPGRN